MRHILIALFLLASIHASAVTYIYSGTGNWTDAANWNIYPAPVSGIVTLNSNDLVQVPFGSDLTINVTVLNTGFFEVYGVATNTSTLNNFGTLFIFGQFGQNGNFTNSGSIKADGIFGGNIPNSGTVQPRGPAGSIGTLDVFGDLNQASGSMISIEIDGDAGAGSPGGHSSIFVWGTLNFDGMLSVTLDMYTPVLGDEFRILDFFGSSGSFSTISLPDISPLQWMVNYNVDNVTLVVDMTVPHNDMELSLEKINDQVELNWVNQNYNFESFTVQRREKDTWKNIYSTTANDQVYFNYMDAPPMGMNYYRVVGQKENNEIFSSVQSIHIGKTNNEFLRAFPNPVQDQLNLEVLDREINSSIDLNILNDKGQVVNQYSLSKDQSSLTLDHLSPGVYILQANQESKRQQIRFVKI